MFAKHVREPAGEIRIDVSVLAVRQRAFVHAAPHYSAATNHSPECRGAFSVAASSVGAVSYACAAMQSKILTVF
jgi:hypothetical protein